MANIGIDMSPPVTWTTLVSTASNSTNVPPSYYYNPNPKPDYPGRLVERQVSRYLSKLPWERPPELQSEIEAACAQYGTSNAIIVPVIRSFVIKEKAEWDKGLPALTEQG